MRRGKVRNDGLQLGDGGCRVRCGACQQPTEVVSVRYTRAHIWDAPICAPAKLEQNSFDERSVIEDDVRDCVGLNPR